MGDPGSLTATTAWERLADTLLQREAGLCRVVAGVPPRDIPGLYVADGDLEGLLRSLPGLDWPEDEPVREVRDAFAGPVEEATAGFARWAVSAREPWARAVMRAGAMAADLAVLAVVLAVELSPQRQRLLAYVQDDVHLPRPTLATLRRLFPHDVGAAAVAPGAALSRARLLVADDHGPWARRMVGVPGRVVWSALGVDEPDPGLPATAAVRRVAGEASDALSSPVLVLAHGGDPESRRVAAARLLGGTGLLVTPLPQDEREWAAVVREAGLCGVGVLIEVTGPLPVAAAAALTRAAHVPWGVSSARELPLECLPPLPLREVGVTDGTAGTTDWRGRLGIDPPPGVRLSREQLRLVAMAVSGEPASLPVAVRRLAGGHLESLAVRVRPRRGWQDLVVPPLQAAQLRELVARHRRKGTVFGDWGFPAVPSSGAVALFAGPSGTGKTLAAEVVAGELGLDLYKVDLAAVVSKYIGETEKNLERIFGAAAAGDLVLFFDEADALFGKRSEVSDSHDRYANIEVAYLLQRLESYDGLVVLATNLQRNIDEAFLRRIGVSVTFPAPDVEQRRRIWELAIPPTAPTEDLDLDHLAQQYAVTGGIIRSAALGAAFMAADADGPITMDRVLQSLRREFAKLGHLADS